MIDEVRAGYAALLDSAPPEKGEFRLHRLSSVRGIFLGVDASRVRHLLLERAGGARIAGTTAIDITTRHLLFEGDDLDLVDVTCRIATLDEVFDHFVVAVGERVRDAGSGPDTAARDVLDSWREFLTIPREKLSQRLVAAVIAELLVLRDLAARDPDRAIDAWDTASRARHDFRLAARAIEVKSTIAHTARVVTIHGVDQLDVPTGGRLLLHLVRLEPVADGSVTLGSCVDSLLEAGTAAVRLYKALARRGVEVASARDSTFRFELRERTTFPVDEHTPRLVPDIFPAGKIPAGIDDITYRLDLDHVLDRALPDHEVAAELDMMLEITSE